MRAAADLHDEELRAELKRTQLQLDNSDALTDVDDLMDLAARCAELDVELKRRQQYRLAQAI